jgi:hypothetical protein
LELKKTAFVERVKHSIASPKYVVPPGIGLMGSYSPAAGTPDLNVEKHDLDMQEIKRRYSSLVIQVDRLRADLAQVDSKFRPEDGSKWSLKELLGHLIDVDREIWGPRIERMLAEEHPYFDSIDQDELVKKNRWNELDIAEITAQLMRVRWNYAVLVNGLNDNELARTGSHYSRGSMTVADVLRTLVEHDTQHLAEIRERISPTPSRDFSIEI